MFAAVTDAKRSNVSGDLIAETINIVDQEVRVDTDYLSLSFFDKIKISEIKKLLHLENLKHLNLSSSDLMDEHLEIVGKIESVELLDLDSTEITNQGLQFLEPMKQLKQLRLKDNPQLADKCIGYLSNIASLELIHIGNTSITIDGVRELLSKVELKSLIIDFEFDKLMDELLIITRLHPQLEITLKGTGIISNGKLNG